MSDLTTRADLTTHQGTRQPRLVAVATACACNLLALAVVLTLGGVTLAAESAHPSDPEGFAQLTTVVQVFVLSASIVVSTIVGVIVAWSRAGWQSNSPTPTGTRQAVVGGLIAAAFGLVVPVVATLLFFHP